MRSPKILVVEDEAIQRLGMEETLKEWGYRVESVASAEEAIASVNREIPSLILMDVDLGPGMNGVQCAQMVRLLSKVPLIYLTSLAKPDDLLERARDTHPAAYLLKPVPDEQLRVAIKLAQAAPSTVFICYSHANVKLMERLQRHLQRLSWAGIDVWVDTKIRAGANWMAEINQAVMQAKVALLLVSVDFLNSAFIQTVELPALLEKAREQGVRILPVVLSPCAYDRSVLGAFQAMNMPNKTVEDMKGPERERFWVKVVESVEDELR